MRQLTTQFTHNNQQANELNNLLFLHISIYITIFASYINKKINIMVEKIGADAGKVWTKLDKEGRMNVKDLRKVIKLTERDAFAALGWLAKEGKLTIEKDGRDFYVELSQTFEAQRHNIAL